MFPMSPKNHAYSYSQFKKHQLQISFNWSFPRCSRSGKSWSPNSLNTCFWKLAPSWYLIRHRLCDPPQCNKAEMVKEQQRQERREGNTCSAHPLATASSALSVVLISFPKNRAIFSFTAGIRVVPPTISTALTSSTLSWVCSSREWRGASIFCRRSAQSSSNCALGK